MKRPLVIAVVALVVTLAVAAGAAAQSGALAGLLGPVVVDVQQEVPVSLTVATELEDGAIVTSTVPLTVGVNLQITIDGAQVVSVEPGQAGEAEVAARVLPVGEELVDNNGIPYTIEGPDKFVAVQIRSGIDYGDDFELLGEIRNEDDEEARVEVNLTLFDADGNILDTATGYPLLMPLGPGLQSAFSMATGVLFEDVASYRIQLED